MITATLNGMRPDVINNHKPIFVMLAAAALFLLENAISFEVKYTEMYNQYIKKTVYM